MNTDNSRTITLTLFPDVSAKAKVEQSPTWTDLAERIANPPEYASKESCPLLKLGTFGDETTDNGCLRFDANMTHISGVELDYDDEVMTPAEAAFRLQMAGVKAVIYTSARHTPDKPRWRALVPLSVSYPPEHRNSFASRVNGALGMVAAAESFTLSQSYYFGRVKGAPFESFVVEGEYLDHTSLEETAIPQQSAKSATVKTTPLEDWQQLPDDINEVLARVDPTRNYKTDWIPTVLGTLNSFGPAAVPALVQWSLPWYRQEYPNRSDDDLTVMATVEIRSKQQSENTGKATWENVRERAGLPRVDASKMFGKVEGAAPAQEWTKPQPIPDTLLPVLPFDYGMLPNDLVDWVSDCADRMKAPPEYIAVTVMSILGALIARKVVIRPKRHDTKWHVISNVWAASIGRASMMKSPAIKTAITFAKEIESSAGRAYGKAMKKWKDDSKFADMQASDMDTEARKLLKEKKTSEARAKSDEAEKFRNEHLPPVEKRYITNDATPEILHKLFSENPHGIMNIVDELQRWINDMGKQGREGSRQFHLEANDGDTEYTMDRIVRGANMKATMCETVIGGMQPARLFHHVRAATSGEGDDDGLLQRFSLIVWPDPVPFSLVDRAPDERASNRAKQLFRRFDDLPLLFNDEGYLRPIVVGFSDAAQIEFNEWYSRHMHEMRSGGDYLAPALVSHLLKYAKAIPALALVISQADGEQEVSTLTWQKVMRWYAFLRSHAERVYDYANKQLDELARTVVRKILDTRTGKALGEKKVLGSGTVTVTVITVRQVMRAVNALSSDAELTRNVLELLAELHYLRDLSAFKEFGKDAFVVNPVLFEDEYRNTF